MMRITHCLHAGRCLVFGPAFLIPAAAAVWIDPNWALVAEVQPEVIYDTNLTARHDSISDTYARLTPKLTLSRRGSETRLDLDAEVTRTWFNDFTEFNSTDPQANLLYEFPAGPGDEATSHLDLHWGRTSSTNTDLGRRLRSDNLHGRWEQRVFDTGRTGFTVRLDGRSTDYLDGDLNTNNAYAVEGRAGYAVTPQARLGIGYGHEWSRSLGAAGRGDTRGNEDRVIVRANGDLLPKVHGSLETGVAFVKYSGVVRRSDTAWIAAVDLTWDASPLTVGTLRASRYTDFSPEGETALRSELMVDLTQRVGRGFALRGGGGIARVQRNFDAIEHHANAVILVAGITYELTERFSAGVTERWTRQNEDRDSFDYSRNVVSGQMTFTF